MTVRFPQVEGGTVGDVDVQPLEETSERRDVQIDPGLAPIGKVEGERATSRHARLGFASGLKKIAAVLRGKDDTDTNLATLQTRANSILADDGKTAALANDELTMLGVSDVTPLSQRYRINLPAHAWPPGSIRTEGDRAAVEEQVVAAAELARQIHVQTRGRDHGLFKFIDIVPGSQLERPMQLDGERLTIGVPEGVFGYQPANVYSLRRDFDAGEHLDTELLAKRWELINPVGEFRTMLRSEIGRLTGTLQQAFKKAKAKKGEDKKADVRALVKAHVDPSFMSGPGHSLVDEALAMIDRIAADDLDAVLDRWGAELGGDGRADDVADALLAVNDAMSETTVKGKIRLEGRVAYGNFHNIDVGVHLSDGGLARYVTLAPKTLDLDVEVKGKWFAGYTVDNVNVTLSAHRLLETAGLDRALEHLR